MLLQVGTGLLRATDAWCATAPTSISNCRSRLVGDCCFEDADASKPCCYISVPGYCGRRMRGVPPQRRRSQTVGAGLLAIAVSRTQTLASHAATGRHQVFGGDHTWRACKGRVAWPNRHRRSLAAPTHAWRVAAPPSISNCRSRLAGDRCTEGASVGKPDGVGPTTKSQT